MSVKKESDTIKDRLREDSEYPLSEWVNITRPSRRDEPRWVAGEDPQSNWVADVTQWTSSDEFSATIYPPEADPDEELSNFDRIGMFETKDEAVDALREYIADTLTNEADD